MQLLQDSPLGEPARRASLLGGALHLFSATPQTRDLCAAVREALCATFPESDPRQAQYLLSPDELFARVRQLRRWLANGALREPLQALLLASGCDPDETYFDSLRLRAVTSGGHRNPAAAPAYYPHRDVWFASPSCQINWWLALFEVREAQGLGFYPGYWERPIENDSARFDYEAFSRAGGWQAYGGGVKAVQHHPTTTEALREPPVQLACARDALLLFSGAHLHATIPHDTGETRFSIELRTFCVEDLKAGGVANLDNASRGSTASDFLRLRDLVLFHHRQA